MNKIDIKKILENYYLKSLNGCNSNFYPIVVIEAIKSIIGINLTKSSDNLMCWLSSYMDNLKNDRFEFTEIIKERPEVISYKDFEQNIVARDIDKSYENLSFLMSVSDGGQVIEFLLELSIKYSSASCQLIWSIYRMEMFLSKKFLFKSLQVCVKFLINDLSCTNIVVDEAVDWEHHLKGDSKDIYLYYSIYHTKLIRSEKINKFIGSNLCINQKVNTLDFECKILKNQDEFGRQWILDYLNNISLDNIDMELILKMNELRSCLNLVKTNREKLILWGQLNRYIDAIK